MQASLRVNARCAPAASVARRSASRPAVASIARPLAAKARASSPLSAVATAVAAAPKGLGASRLASRTVVSR